MTSRSMVKLIHADGFFPPGDAERYAATVSGLQFTEKEYGLELADFNMIFPKIEPLMSKVIGERIQIHHERSGLFRRPYQVIHFEGFDSLNEWCFIIALEKTTLNLCCHISDPSLGDVSPVDAWTALDGWKFNYRNLFEWKVHTNVILEPNQCVFFRPWVFHYLEDGLVQYYRLIADQKFRILVMGLPGSCRSEIARKLHETIPESILLNSMDIRKRDKDIDFSESGISRHNYRMLTEARNAKSNVVIIDKVMPLHEMREILAPDVIIWANDVQSSQYEDLNKIFEPPRQYDYKINKLTDDTYNEILDRIQSKRY